MPIRGALARQVPPEAAPWEAKLLGQYSGHQIWLAIPDRRSGDDRRELRLAFTATGKRAYLRAFPDWERVQAEFVRALGVESWNRLMELSVETAGI